jgi:hypothetical protein
MYLNHKKWHIETKTNGEFSGYATQLNNLARIGEVCQSQRTWKMKASLLEQ